MANGRARPVLARYTVLLYTLLPLLLLRLVLRGFRNRGYWRRWPERFGFVSLRPHRRTIWVHAVSVGEVRASQPLIKTLLERYPVFDLVVTTMTPTGSEQVRLLFGDRVLHCYVPYDFPSAVKRFLRATRPAIALVMETELWPNIFHLCGQMDVPILIANVRLSERSMRGYQRIPRLAESTLRQVRTFAVQSTADAGRLRRLGAPASAIKITGNIKFDINLPASVTESGWALRDHWGRERPVLLAASTHEGEEGRLLDAYRQLLARHPDLLLIVVPRHPERFAGVSRLCQRTGLRVGLRSRFGDTVDTRTQILVGDTMGELLMFYAACDVAFVGGSLVHVGGHNVLEAAALAKPVVFGPEMFNFEEIRALSLERGAGIQVSDVTGLVGAVAGLLDNAEKRYGMGQAGRRMVEENRGALNRTVALIEHLVAAAS